MAYVAAYREISRRLADVYQKAYSDAKCLKWFKKYEDAVEPNVIGPEGIEALCADIQFAAESVGAQRMGYFTKDEWKSGMSKLRAFSPASLMKQLSMTTQKVLHNPKSLENLHKYAFSFAKLPMAKNVDLETAIALWQLCFPQHRDRIIRFEGFLREKQPVKVINRDQWLSMYEFLTLVNDNLYNYDDISAAWPTLLDEFVEWQRRQQ